MNDYSPTEITEINKVLDDVEDVFNSLIQSHGLNNTRIDRWRWGEPAITLSWEQDDDISRNIHADVQIDGKYRLDVEVNAWRDIIKSNSGKKIRRWQHEPIDTVPTNPPEIQSAIDEAFNHVTQLGGPDLTKRKELS